MPDQISYKTFDGVTIVGDWYPTTTTVGVVILLHMMPIDRKSWAPFQKVLAANNIASLAIDMRGHGDSTVGEGGIKLDYKTFKDIQHQQTLNDISGAIDWLTNKNYPKSQIVVVGASIGANLALWSLEQEPSLAGAVLLSPGNYRGMDSVAQAGEVLPHQSLLAAGSDTDDPEAYEAARAIIERCSSSRKSFLPYKNAGHGIHLFASDPTLMDKLAEWIRETIQTPIQ
ncbi:alpha/beta fold hydrolase [Patescibacteria group bacterium]|nr:alpha/beta fold hydrolase [Patescibacteria group bacterium]